MVAATVVATAVAVAMAAAAVTEAAEAAAADGPTVTPTLTEDTAAAMAAAIGAGTTRATRGTAADPENPLSGEPMVAPEQDPDPDPGSGKGAAGPGRAVTRHTKGPQETVRIPELNTVWKSNTLQHCNTYCSHFFLLYEGRSDF